MAVDALIFLQRAALHEGGRQFFQRHCGSRVLVSSSPGSLTVDTFELKIGDMNDADLQQLHSLSIAVGWPHRAEDWQFLRETGSGIVALDEIGRVMGSAMWFPQGEGMATIGMVITSPRLQANGAGHWLMQKVMRECDGRDFRLNATRAARRLYMSLDFRTEKKVFQCQGQARLPGGPYAIPDRCEVRPLARADLDAAIALDALSFGVARAAVIEKLWDQSQGFGMFREDALVAFALCRRFGRGHVVGPVVAPCDDDAISVVRPHLENHAGKFLRLDTYSGCGTFSAFLSRSGLPIFDTVTTMSLGRSLDEYSSADVETGTTFGLASQALG